MDPPAPMRRSREWASYARENPRLGEFVSNKPRDESLHRVQQSPKVILAYTLESAPGINTGRQE
jgi:hypothetical protein